MPKHGLILTEITYFSDVSLVNESALNWLTDSYIAYKTIFRHFIQFGHLPSSSKLTSISQQLPNGGVYLWAVVTF